MQPSRDDRECWPPDLALREAVPGGCTCALGCTRPDRLDRRQDTRADRQDALRRRRHRSQGRKNGREVARAAKEGVIGCPL